MDLLHFLKAEMRHPYFSMPYLFLRFVSDYASARLRYMGVHFSLSITHFREIKSPGQKMPRT